MFNESKPKYQEALKASGYSFDLKYEKKDIHTLNNNNKERKRRSRKRQVWWFNPPWDSRVASNVGAKFLSILDRCIPRGHVLYPLFNRHTVKISYRCLGNLGKKVSIHNNMVYSKHNQEQIRVREFNKRWRSDWTRQAERDRAEQQRQADRLAAREAAAAHRQGVAAARQAARQAARHEAALARHAAQVQRHAERPAARRGRPARPPGPPPPPHSSCRHIKNFLLSKARKWESKHGALILKSDVR